MDYRSLSGVEAVKFIQTVNDTDPLRCFFFPTVPKAIILKIVLPLATIESGKPAVRPGEVVFEVFGHK